MAEDQEKELLELLYKWQTNQAIWHDDRRNEARRMYDGRCGYTVFKKRHFPEDHEFQDVRCYDISSGGIGFFVDEPIRTRNVVVKFAVAEGCVYLRGAVRRCQEVLQLASGAIIYPSDKEALASLQTNPQPVKRKYLVGVQFTGRLKRPATARDTQDAQPAEAQ